jgi:SAM-dependent methyltransferase
VSGATPYTFKPEPRSSHSRMLACVPANGAGKRALDIGGGEGYLSAELDRRGFDAVCVAAPGTAAAGLPASIRMIEADLDFDLPAFERPFDYIICGDVLEHLRRPRHALDWIVRSLAPEGTLIASLPNGTHAYVRLQILLGRFPKDDRGLFDRTHLHFFPWKGWVDLFEASGLTIADVWPTPVPFGLALERWRGTPPVRALEQLSYAMAVSWKSLLAYQFVVRATRRRR